MNASLPAIPQELRATPLADIARQVEPRLLELMVADEVETHLRRFIRQLRISAELDAVSKKDIAT